MQQVYKDIYKNEIILPKSPLRSLNCYIIHSEGDTLVIDTGYRTEEGYKSFLGGLAELGIRLEDVRLFITHGHADHCGLCGLIKDKIKMIYMGEKEGHEVQRMSKVPNRSKIMLQTLDLERYMPENIEHTEYDKYLFYTDFDYTPVRDGNIIRVGRYSFIAIETPGHTPGHLCLYEPEHKIMFTGDHVLGRISPNIAFWGFEYGDILGTFFESLDKIKSYDVELTLGAHRELTGTLEERVNELLHHHQERLDEIISLLDYKTWQSASTIASQMQWAIKAEGGWNSYPFTQIAFATLETMSHLIHLTQNDIAEIGDRDGVAIFKKH